VVEENDKVVDEKIVNIDAPSWILANNLPNVDHNVKTGTPQRPKRFEDVLKMFPPRVDAVSESFVDGGDVPQPFQDTGFKPVVEHRKVRKPMNVGNVAAGMIVVSLVTVIGLAVANPGVLEKNEPNPVLGLAKNLAADFGDGSSVNGNRVLEEVLAQPSQTVSDSESGASPDAPYAFLKDERCVQGVKVPARWCSGTIGYTIDFTFAKEMGLKLRVERARWRKTFNSWSKASDGLYTFKFEGVASHPIQTGDGGFSRKITGINLGTIGITYAQPFGGSPSYRNSDLSDALGVGGTDTPVFDKNLSPTQTGQVRTAAITLRAADLSPRGTRPTRVYVHEAGHALGLGHVSDRRQIMFDKTLGPRLPQSGDKAGLKKLAGYGCS